MKSLQQELKKYNYHLPLKLVAQQPAKNREQAKILIYKPKNKKIAYDIFKNIHKYLPKNSVLVFNQTRVIPARLELTKPSGGKVRALYLNHQGRVVEILANKKLVPKSVVYFMRGRALQQQMLVQKKVNNHYFLKLLGPIKNPLTLFEKYGETPLPPYIKHSRLTETDRKKYYQTVFAKTGLSVAAPTAGLHFTKALIGKLKKQGIAVKFVNLNVGLGTFAPLTEKSLLVGKLHRETYRIDDSTAKDLNKYKKQLRPIIAVGTTVVRTLESAAKNKKLAKLSGSTELFIRPGFKFQIIDGLVTNFHVPKSSLLMLVASLIGRKKLLELYTKAIHRQFKFFSFGDGLAIIP